MKKGIEHEKMRFKTMTPTQLVTRLNRITQIEKLQCYISVAKELGYPKLAGLAKEKLSLMQNTPQQSNVKFTNLKFFPAPIVLTKAQEDVVTQEIYSVRPTRKFNFD